jgi:hypothetical protein
MAARVKTVLFLIILAAGPAWFWGCSSPSPSASIATGFASYGARRNGNIYASAARGSRELKGPVLLHDLGTGERIGSYIPDQKDFWFGGILQNGDIWVQLVDDPQHIRFVDVKTGRYMLDVPGVHGFLSPDGKWIAVKQSWDKEAQSSYTAESADRGVMAGQIFLHEVSTGRTFVIRSDTAGCFSPDSKLLLTQRCLGQSMNEPCEISAWDIPNGRQKFKFRMPTFCDWPRFSPKGTALLWPYGSAGPRPGGNVVVDTETGKILLELPRVPGYAFSQDDRIFVAIMRDPTLGWMVQRWKLPEAEKLKAVVLPSRLMGDDLTYGTISPDGKLVAVTILRETPSLLVRTSIVSWLPPRLLWLASGTRREWTEVLDAETGELLATLPQCGYCFFVDNRRLACEMPWRVDLWDIPPKRSPWRLLCYSSLWVTFVSGIWWWDRRRVKRRPLLAVVQHGPQRTLPGQSVAGLPRLIIE